MLDKPRMKDSRETKGKIKTKKNKKKYEGKKKQARKWNELSKIQYHASIKKGELGWRRNQLSIMIKSPFI